MESSSRSRQVTKFRWKIENFSLIETKKHYSDNFFVGGNPWRVLIFPEGNTVEHYLSIYLVVADAATLPSGWTRYARVRFSIINQIKPKSSTYKETSHKLNKKECDWGYTEFLSLSELHDPRKGYLKNDTCLVEVDVSTDESIDLPAPEFIVESDPNEADHGKPALKKQKTAITNPEEEINASALALVLSCLEQLPSNAQPCSSIETIKPKEYPSEEDMDALFTSLESVLASHKVYSSEEVKEAISIIEEALCMAPASATFFEIGKLSTLDKAFKVLSSSDCSSALTVEQKTELLALEKNLKEVPQRVAKATQDKALLSEKESLKLTLTRDLEHSLNFFKQGKAELIQIEQKIASLHEQVDEEEKKKTDILAARAEKFKITNDKKMELEALGKEWPEYEAKAKAAEDELKTVAAEWSRMKDFISSTKESFRKGTD
ncbi:TRAF-like family protein [Corchorus capsularis]|uniref:TRAF-like family protein n=1 Tax=Corchorus capsularis TaxID=210143 RepID=A0A1R3J1D4_COCAP|nr:TRAF-like family protein [Corchorus capsularis]